jgi:hypothetical protein
MSLPGPLLDVVPERDTLWDHCRNALGIARLLAEERRPAPLVATACHVAVESACRAALAQAGLRFDGDLGRGLRALAAPSDLWRPIQGARVDEHVAAAQRAVGWAAAYLRSEAPDRAWGY